MAVVCMKRERRLRPALHLTAPAGSCLDLMKRLGCTAAGDLISLVQTTVGLGYRVTGDQRVIEAPEDDDRGGRTDDARRAADVQRALGDDRVAAIVTLRGGAWLTRILPRIDFHVLRRRSTRLAIFGFSELTTVINIASAYAKAVCWYDMGPAFIPAGLSRDGRPSGECVRERLHDFVTDAVAMIEGRGSCRRIEGRLVSGRLAASTAATIVGGTPSVLVSLIGTPYARSLFRPGRWLALEDVNEAPHRLDRMLAHLKLAGILDRCAGLLLGDFHEGEHDRTGQVLASLRHLLPKRPAKPIIVTKDFGHIWPMAPLLIGRRVDLLREGDRVRLAVPWSKLATVAYSN